MRPLAALFAPLSALALCLTLNPSCAPHPNGPDPALWRLSDADSTVWLFGSVHVLPPGLAWRTERIDSALAGAEILVLETDTGRAAETAFASLVSRYGREPRERTLAALIASGTLSTADRERLERQARAAGLDPTGVETLRPWLAALQISLAVAVSQGHSVEAGVEAALVETAEADGKIVQALETPEQQIRTLADLPVDDELAFLRETLRQIDEAPETLDALDRAWASGDVETLARLTERDMRSAGNGVYEALITRRNAAWTSRIRALLAGNQDVFVAVGAAHLVGDDSVVAQLRAQGLTIEGP
jgi:uncharacterized protein YbaP (TraB family)